MKIKLIFCIFMSMLLSSCSSSTKNINRKDFERFFKQYKVRGSFLLYDERHDTYLYYNKKGNETSYIPASTFKIPNALIGLDLGVLKSDTTTFAWDSVIYPKKEWNRPQNLTSAFRNSTVWYFQKLARGIGENRMKDRVIQMKYGNMETKGNPESFWLDGSLRISPKQQIDFLRRLRNNKIDVSEQAMDFTKKIMIASDTLGYVVRQKTGHGVQNGKENGWLVGYIENNQNTFYFASCIQSDSIIPGFDGAKVHIPYQIFNSLNLFRLTRKDKLPEF